jgi:hypothetical protein
MTSGSDISPKHIAFYDPERKGIFIHNDQLKESPFEIGDRFSVRKKGIFIERTRKIDILLGGIFDEYVIYIEPEIPQTIKIKALEIVKDNSQKWF